MLRNAIAKINIQFLKEEQLTTLLYIFVLVNGLILLYPILICGQDLWDGLIISYAWESRSSDIYATWFNESGWPIVTQMYRALHLISELLDAHIKYLVNIVIVSSLILATRELYKIGIEHFKWDEKASLLSALWLLVSPVLGLFFSSVFLMHAFFLYFCLLGSRLFLAKKHVVACIILIVSFQHNANLITFGCIILLAHTLQRSWPSKNDCLYFAIVVVGFFTMRFVFTPHGLYAGYNSINSDNLFNYAIYEAYLLYFYRFLWPALAAVLILLILEKKSRLILMALIASTIITVVPYVLAGKTVPNYFPHAVQAWDYRFVLNEAVICSLLSGFIFNYLSTNKVRVFSKSASVLCLLTQLALNYYLIGVVFKFRAQELVYRQSLVDELKAPSSKIESGLVQVKDRFLYTNYEMNSLFFQAFGHREVTLGPRASFESNGELKYRNKYIQPITAPACSYALDVQDNLDELNSFSLIKTLYYNDFSLEETEITTRLTLLECMPNAN